MFTLKNIWMNRRLIIHFAVLHLTSKYYGTRLGFLWTILEPLLMFTVLYLVFTNIRTYSEEFFPVYLFIGIIFFHTFARGTLAGLSSLRSNSGIVTSINLPTEIFPIISTISFGILALIEISIFFSLMPLFGFMPQALITLLPIPFMLLLFLILGLSFLLSIISVYVKDIQYFWSAIVYGIFFITPIFWHLTDVGEVLFQMHQFNPLGQIVELSHKIVFNETPAFQEWLLSISYTTVVFILGYIVFIKYKKIAVEEL